MAIEELIPRTYILKLALLNSGSGVRLSYRVGIVVVVGVIAHVKESLDQPGGQPVVAPSQRGRAVVVDGDVVAPWIANEKI